MKFYLKGKKVTRKAVTEKLGKAETARRVKEAKQAYAEDPWEEISWMDGLEIRF